MQIRGSCKHHVEYSCVAPTDTHERGLGCAMEDKQSLVVHRLVGWVEFAHGHGAKDFAWRERNSNPVCVTVTCQVVEKNP